MGSIKAHQNQPKAAQTSPKQPKLFKNHLECNFYTLNPSQKYFVVFWARLNHIVEFKRFFRATSSFKVTRSVTDQL